MGNQLGFYISSDDEEAFDTSDSELGLNVINFTVNAMDMELRSPCYHSNDLPVIRNKPNLEKFQVIMKYPTPTDHRK